MEKTVVASKGESSSPAPQERGSRVLRQAMRFLVVCAASGLLYVVIDGWVRVKWSAVRQAPHGAWAWRVHAIAGIMQLLATLLIAIGPSVLVPRRKWNSQVLCGYYLIVGFLLGSFATLVEILRVG